MKRFVNGQEVELSAEGVEVNQSGDRLHVRTPEGAFSAIAIRQGETTLISYKGRQFKLDLKAPRVRAGAIFSGEMHAPMPGLIADVLVEEGALVKKGQKLLVLEAMKTQQPFIAPFDGVIRKLPARKGEQVAEGALLALVEPA